MPTNAFPSTVSQVDTAARFPLGYEVTVPAKASGTEADRGEEVWIYVQASEALVVGSVCSLTAAATTYIIRKVPINTHACTVVGVAQHVIGLNAYGFIQKKGFASVLADAGGVTANLGLIVGDAVGTADAAAAATDASFGVAQATAAEATANCWINCAG